MILDAYTRVFVDADAIDRTVSFYKTLLAGDDSLRFSYPEKGLELAVVSSPHLSVLVIAGPAHARAPFEATHLTIKVEAMKPLLEVLTHAGALQLGRVEPTPIGHKARFRHPDGLIVEYVVHTVSGAS